MGSKALASTILLLSLNLLFFTLVSSHYVPCPPPPKKPHTPKTPPKAPKSPPMVPSKPPPKAPKSPPMVPSKPPKAPKSPPMVPTKPSLTCPVDTLKLGACANLLNDLVGLALGGKPSDTPCCQIIGGLTDLEAAVCLCTAIKANVLGVNLNVPVSVSLLLNTCGKKVPKEYQCA